MFICLMNVDVNMEIYVILNGLIWKQVSAGRWFG
jgi:hypothetical protein